MPGSVNQVIITGHVGSNPVKTFSETGHNRVNITICTADYMYVGTELKVVDVWHKVTSSGKIARDFNLFVRKGDLINVIGELNYVGPDGSRDAVIFARQWQAFGACKHPCCEEWRKSKESQYKEEMKYA